MDGPARYFADHPMAYGLALTGAGGTALYALTVALRPGDRRRRLLFAALGVQCAAQFLGIVLATERSRHRFQQGDDDSRVPQISSLRSWPKRIPRKAATVPAREPSSGDFSAA